MLKDKVAIVTGGSRGIGKAIALRLAKEQANIVIADINKDLAEATAKELESLGIKTLAVQCDVSSYESAGNLIETTLKEMGSIDIIVNNAGITRDMLMLKMTEEQFDQVLNVNLKGAWNVLKHAAKSMLKQRSGKIINIASVVGIIGNAGQCNYSAAKAGMIGMTKSLAKEYAARGIQVNAVAPGFIDTDMTAVLPDKVKEELLRNIPLGKLGKPEDIANAVCFLASSQADYITGQVLQVDGGMVM